MPPAWRSTSEAQRQVRGSAADGSARRRAASPQCAGGCEIVSEIGPSAEGAEVVLPVAATATPSLRKNFAARALSDAYGLVAGLIAATLTARLLGPSGRGFYASLMLIALLLIQLYSAGLGEAATVLPGRGETTLAVAVSSSLALLAPLGAAAAATFYLSSALILRPSGGGQLLAISLGALLVMLNVYSNTLAGFLTAREKLVVLAGVIGASTTVTTAALFALLTATPLGVAGAVLASVIGAVIALSLSIVALWKEQISLKPRLNRPYVRRAVRFGSAIVFSNLLVQMTGRLDLLLAYRIAGRASAGMYSIALTVGTLVGAIPLAIAFASFPRLPKLSDEEAEELTARLFRVGVVTAVLTGILLAVASPLVIPRLFGFRFEGAVLPTLLILPGGVFWSGQWLLSRAAAARGVTRPLSTSFAVSFLLMVAMDLVLIPAFGIVGAAAASSTASLAGFAVAAAYARRMGCSLRTLVPRGSDLHAMAQSGRSLASSLITLGRASRIRPGNE
ncbi:MAG TPA: oligosaccharide flippase family protein [Actinomycetota bacterium]|nr:oligosaccharide flippase family protein [Actinomycetota bacterium]